MGGQMDIETYLKDRSGKVNAFLKSYFEKPLDAATPPVIREAMSYSVLAGGKRLRPVLLMAAYEACGGSADDIVYSAASIEVVHTYSLIHDDLPSMDDDDLRRGRPTSHKVFGEAVAILAGDALLTEAFLMMLDMDGPVSRELMVEAIRELALASGVRGMVGGQVQDIISEGAAPDPVTLNYIHTRKTGALIAASVKIGGILAGAADDRIDALARYGQDLGYAFQIVDDILDVRGDTEVLGKPAGSDAERNKMTYPALYGLDESMKRAAELIRSAVSALGAFGPEADPLRGIAEYILTRSN